MDPLADKVIVIIGGTTGLGLAGACACVEAGARVVAVGRKPESVAAAARALGDRARVLRGDATAPETAGRAIETAVEELGGFDGLYHVAGGSGRSMGDGPLHELTDAGWRETLELNLTSVFNSNRAAVAAFRRRGTGGAVLNMTSVLAFSPAPEFFATHAYAATKAAIIGLTTSAAAYYAREGIRFNAVAPALVETPMARRAAGDETIMDYIAAKQPLDGGRIGRPADLDGAVVFLLSERSAFVTGQVLAVDGGWTVTEAQAREGHGGRGRAKR